MSEFVELPNGRISTPYEGYLTWKIEAEKAKQALAACQQDNERLTNENAELKMALRVAHLPLPPAALEGENGG